MRVLVFSYMYPSTRHPIAGVWVEDQVRKLSERVSVDVVSPVPWAPRILWPLSHRWRAYGCQPSEERRHGIIVYHPRYLQPVGQWSMPFAGMAMALGAGATVRKLMSRGGLDVIHVHQLLPDGLAAVLLGRRLRKPVICTLHGSDVTTVPFHDRGARAAARYVARNAAGFVAVEGALLDCLRRVDPNHAPAYVVPNGIDLERFRPFDVLEARARLSIEPGVPVILYAGLLIERKGVDILLKAFARLLASFPAARLVLVGGSLERDDRRVELERLADSLGCRERVLFAGRRPYDELPLWYAAADVFALASRLEGFPTVVREAIACGTPVVATALPGMLEEIGPACGVECGTVVPLEDPEALSSGLARELQNRRNPEELRKRAELWHWDRNVDRLLAIYAGCVGENGSRTEEIPDVRFDSRSTS